MGRPQPQHRRLGSRTIALRPARIATVLTLVGLLVLGVGAAATMRQLSGNITTSPLRAGSSVERGAAHGDLNILLLGSDSRDLAEESFGEADGSRRSDAMVLAHLSADDDRIDAVQLPRDTLLDLPACEDTGHGSFPGGRGMLNAALNYGPACSVAAVEELTGVPVDHFVELDFEGFMAIIDALGGLPVCLPDALEDPAADLDLPAGQQTLGGKDALALARTRHAVGDGSDIARLGHQQMVMSAVVQEATSRQVIARPDRLYSFLDATTSALTVDPGLSGIADMAALGSRVSRVPTEDITFLTMPWQAAPGDPNRVVPSAEAEAVFEHLKRDSPLVSAGGGASQDEGREGGVAGDAGVGGDDGGAAAGGDDDSAAPGEDGHGATEPAAPAVPTGTPATPQESAGVTPSGTAVRSADVDLCAS